MTINRKTRDRRGGHRCSPIINREGVVHVDPGMKRFLKRDKAKQLRRQRHQIVEQQLMEFHAGLHADRIEDSAYDDFDESYFDDLFRDYLNKDFDYNPIEPEDSHYDDFDPFYYDPYPYELESDYCLHPTLGDSETWAPQSVREWDEMIGKPREDAMTLGELLRKHMEQNPS